MRGLAERATGLAAAYAVALQVLLVSWLPMPALAMLGGDPAFCGTTAELDFPASPHEAQYRLCATSCALAGGSEGLAVSDARAPSPAFIVTRIVWFPAFVGVGKSRPRTAALPRAPPVA